MPYSWKSAIRGVATLISHGFEKVRFSQVRALNLPFLEKSFDHFENIRLFLEQKLCIINPKFLWILEQPSRKNFELQRIKKYTS